jgi:hypothetical protein
MEGKPVQKTPTAASGKMIDPLSAHAAKVKEKTKLINRQSA